MGVVEKFLDIMGFTEVSEEGEDNEINPLEDLPDWKSRRKGQIVPLHNNKDQVKVVLLEPNTFEDCQQISDNLKHKRTVIINLENMDLTLARRIIDFVGGTAYALGGTLQKIGTGIIIAVPNNVDISGEINNMTQPKEVLAWINKVNQTSDIKRY